MNKEMITWNIQAIQATFTYLLIQFISKTLSH